MDQEAYKINVKGLRLYAYHGVHPEENRLGQEFEIDLVLSVVRPATMDDQLENVLSYWDAMKTIKEVFTGKTFKLLENAAFTILESLAQYPQITHAEINLKKLTPPIPVTVDFVGVIMEKSY